MKVQNCSNLYSKTRAQSYSFLWRTFTSGYIHKFVIHTNTEIEITASGTWIRGNQQKAYPLLSKFKCQTQKCFLSISPIYIKEFTECTVLIVCLSCIYKYMVYNIGTFTENYKIHRFHVETKYLRTKSFSRNVVYKLKDIYFIQMIDKLFSFELFPLLIPFLRIYLFQV